jgi:hypothetical protein
MKLKIALDEKMMDVRLRDRLLADGKISQEEINKFLSELGNDEDNLSHIKED